MARIQGRRREVAALIDRSRAWAQDEPDVAGVVLVGSWACGKAGMSSDVDLLVLVESPAARIVDQRWLADLVRGSRPIRRRQWGPVVELRRRTSSGLHVEIGVASPGWASRPLASGTARVLGDGAVVVHDPGDVLARAVTAAQEGRQR